MAVVKVRPGETVLLGGGGRRAEATVTHTAREAFTARLESVTDEPEPEPRFVLVQALAKGGRDEQAVETATELGVDEVVPWQSARGVVVWRGRDREERGRRRWESVCVAATKQSRRARVPVVAAPATTEDVAARVSDAALAVVLHQAAVDALSGVEVPTMGDVVVVVGPEGGITDGELAFLAVRGWPPGPARPRGAALLDRRTGRARGARRGRPLAVTAQPTENGTMFWKAMLPSFMLISIARNSYSPAASVPRSTVHEPCCGQADVAMVWPCLTTEPP